MQSISLDVGISLFATLWHYTILSSLDHEETTMHLNRKINTTKLLSLFLGATFLVPWISDFSRGVYADEEVSTSNLLVSATVVDDNVSPKLELNNRNINRLGRCDDGTLIIFDLRRCPLRFDYLPSRQKNRLSDQYGENASSLYELGVSQEIITFLESSKNTFPGLQFALRGFPFVGANFSFNTDHQLLIQSVDAFIPTVTNVPDAVQAVETLMLLANGRPIITGFQSADSESQEVDPDNQESSQAHASQLEIAELVQDLSMSEAIAFLQTSWGEGASQWDLNNDGSVSGIDLALLMSYYEIDTNDESDSSDDSSNSDSDNESDSGSDDSGSDDSGSDDSGSDDSGSDDSGSDDSGSDDSSDGSEIDTLIPGNGFSNSTYQPSIQGSSQSPGYGAKAIARWTELPYVTRSEDFYVTVSAFHMSDIKRVDFFLDGGQRVRTTEVVPHPESGYAEYMAKIDVSLLTTGLHEVRAIAYPYHGEPRVLQGEYFENRELHDVNNGNCSFWFQYDPSPNVVTVGGSQGQFQTIDEAIQSMGPAIYGGRIELAPGTHFWLSQSHSSFLNTDERKVLTISAPSGVNRDDVILRGSGNVGHGQGMSVHIQGVTVLTEETPEGGRHNIFQGSFSRANRIFFEDLAVSSIDSEFGWGLLNGHQRLAKPVTEWTLGCWIKDVDFTNIAKGINGVTLAKNVTFYRFSADAFGASPGVIVDLHVDKADPFNANHIQHCDIIQFTSANGTDVENRIFADIVATNHYSQIGHLNGHAMKNFAFVRWSVDSKYNAQTLNWLVPMDHVVLDSCTFKNTRIFFGGTFSHLLVRNTYMNKLAPSDMVHEQVFEFSTCVFDNFRILKTHSLPGVSSGTVNFASNSAPSGSSSDGSDGFIETILSSVNASSYSPFDGNMDIERRGELTNHFYYEASAYDFSWDD
jgi:hypothetical protein